MNEYEDVLKTVAATRVPAFKQKLRRELQTEMTRRPRRSWMGWALVATGGSAFAMAALVIIFVAAPDLPRRIHEALIEPTIATDEPRSDTQTTVIADPAFQSLLRGDDPVETDRAFLANWLDPEQANALDIETVASEKIYTVREYQTSDGKRIMVYTEVDGQEKQQPQNLVY